MEDKTVNLRGKEYTIKFPNVGEYYRIETMKQSLGRGFYNTLLGNSTKAAQNALDIIDIEATLTVLMPELVKDLKVDSFNQLGLKDFAEIRKFYDIEVYPFLKEIHQILNQ